MARADGILDVVRSESIIRNRVVNDGIGPLIMSFGRVFPPATDKNKNGPDLLYHCQ